MDAVLGLSTVTEPPAANKSRQDAANENCVHSQDPDIVVAGDNPRRERDSHGEFLTAIRIAVFFEIFADYWVSETKIDVLEL